jgi:hypothetical protein
MKTMKTLLLKEKKRNLKLRYEVLQLSTGTLVHKFSMMTGEDRHIFDYDD